MIEAGWWRGKSLTRILVPLLAGAIAVSTPAQAQFSAGYKFLEAVKKRDGAAVEETLAVPGSPIVNTRDITTGQTALHLVTQRRDLTWMSYLIGKGANVNARDARGVSPLVMACNLGFIEGVTLLVDAKARVDEASDTGETPLISAVHRRDLEMMRVLLKAGADPDRSDNSGRSARDYAKLGGDGSPLLAEIERNAKPAGQRASGGATYGPSF